MQPFLDSRAFRFPAFFLGGLACRFPAFFWAAARQDQVTEHGLIAHFLWLRQPFWEYVYLD